VCAYYVLAWSILATAHLSRVSTRVRIPRKGIYFKLRERNARLAARYFALSRNRNIPPLSSLSFLRSRSFVRSFLSFQPLLSLYWLRWRLQRAHRAQPRDIDAWTSHARGFSDGLDGFYSSVKSANFPSIVVKTLRGSSRSHRLAIPPSDQVPSRCWKNKKTVENCSWRTQERNECRSFGVRFSVARRNLAPPRARLCPLWRLRVRKIVATAGARRARNLGGGSSASRFSKRHVPIISWSLCGPVVSCVVFKGTRTRARAKDRKR